MAGEEQASFFGLDEQDGRRLIQALRTSSRGDGVVADCAPRRLPSSRVDGVGKLIASEAPELAT